MPTCAAIYSSYRRTSQTIVRSCLPLSDHTHAVMPVEYTPLLRPPPSVSFARLSSLLLLPVLLLLPILLLLPVHVPSVRTQSTPNSNSSPFLSPVFHFAVPYVPHTFLAIGDWGRKGKHGQAKVAHALGHVVENRFRQYGYNPHYIISTGDNFYSKGVQSIDDPDFNASFTDVYTHFALANLPWFSVLGNHDHLGSTDAQLQFSSRDRRWNMPAPYYSRQFADNLLVFFLDTTPFVNTKYGAVARQKSQSPEIQLEWLRRQLADAAPHFYFMIVAHHNMFTMSTAGHLGSRELRQQMLPVLEPYSHRILAYISGHEHSLMHVQPIPAVKMDATQQSPFTNVVDHFITGAGSKLDPIQPPPSMNAQRWEECCGVLPLSTDATVARAVWGASTHGFFAFTFDGKLFAADAINKHGDVIYSYQKFVA